MERLQEGTGVATDLGELQNKLWEAADHLRANSGLKASEYASPVLGLIFLRYADERFAQAPHARFMHVLALANGVDQIVRHERVVVPVAVPGATDPAVSLNPRMQLGEDIDEPVIDNAVERVVLPGPERRIPRQMLSTHDVQITLSICARNRRFRSSLGCVASRDGT